MNEYTETYNEALDERHRFRGTLLRHAPDIGGGECASV